MVLCRRANGSCSCGSTSYTNPLSETTLFAAGPHLIRWSTLVFYESFLRPEQHQKLAIQSTIRKEYGQIRSHLHRVDAGKAWKEYIAAYSSKSLSPSSSQMDFATVKKRHRLSKWRAFLHKFRLGKRKVSCLYTESTPSEVELTAVRSARMVEVFESAAKRLRVSQAMLEMAFHQYASHVEATLSCPEWTHRPVEEEWTIAITAQDLARTDNYDALGRRILTDIDSLAPSNATRACEGTELRRHLSSLSRQASSGGNSRANGNVDSIAHGIRANLLGEHLDLVLRAIWACRSYYFDSFKYMGPKVQCHCRPMQLQECNWCSASTGSSGDDTNLCSTGLFKHHRHQSRNHRGKQTARAWEGEDDTEDDDGAGAAHSARGSLVKYVLHPRVYSDHFNPFIRRRGCFEFVRETATEDLEPLLSQAV